MAEDLFTPPTTEEANLNAVAFVPDFEGFQRDLEAEGWVPTPLLRKGAKRKDAAQAVLGLQSATQPRATKAANKNQEKQSSERILEKQKRKQEKKAAALADQAAVKARRAAAAAERAAFAAQEAANPSIPLVSEPPTPQYTNTMQAIVPEVDDLTRFDAQIRETAAQLIPESADAGQVLPESARSTMRSSPEEPSIRTMVWPRSMMDPYPHMPPYAPLPDRERLAQLSDASDPAVLAALANAGRAARRFEEGFRPYSARMMDMQTALTREMLPMTAANQMALARAAQLRAQGPPQIPKLNTVEVAPQAAQQQQSSRNRPSATMLPPSVAPSGSVLRQKPADSTPSPASVAAAVGVAAAVLNARNRTPVAESAATATSPQLSASSQSVISPNAPNPQQPMESASTALAVSNPTAHHMMVPSATRSADNALDINPTQWTLLHRAAFEMIEQSLPNLSPSERSEVTDSFYKITHKKNGKGNKPKAPKLEALNRVALRAAELEANRMRVVFGEKMRAIRKHRHGLVHHANGGYTPRMAAAPRIVPVAPGQKIRTRGWVQRDKGYVMRKAEKQARTAVQQQIGSKKLSVAPQVKEARRTGLALSTVQSVAAHREAVASNMQEL
jgi:hypothetical protein